jgi:hypothetical protein
MVEVNYTNNIIEVALPPPVVIEINNTPIAIRGMSAYEVAVNNVTNPFAGTEQEWLDSLKASTVQWNSTNW